MTSPRGSSTKSKGNVVSARRSVANRSAPGQGQKPGPGTPHPRFQRGNVLHLGSLLRRPSGKGGAPARPALLSPQEHQQLSPSVEQWLSEAQANAQANPGDPQAQEQLAKMQQLAQLNRHFAAQAGFPEAGYLDQQANAAKPLVAQPLVARPLASQNQPEPALPASPASPEPSANV